jgi:hypothetical protein
MVVNINKKPIKVVEDNGEHKEKGWVYVGVSCLGMVMGLALLDYIAFVFFYIHPFPFVAWLGKWLGAFL